MPLTRHLYAEDEVVAALQFCVLRGRTVEAAFWCEELVYSEMIDSLFTGLRTIWLYGFGIGALSWYRRFEEISLKDELDLDELVGLVVGLCRLGLKGRRDVTYLILAGTMAEAEQAAYCILPKWLKEKEAYFIACVDQGRCISAWRAFGSVSPAILKLAAQRKHGEAGACACACDLEPALTVAALCLPKGELSARLAEAVPGTLSEVEGARADWAPLSRRARRRYPIPHDCLYWLTVRGAKSVYESSEKLLRGSLERPKKLWGASYWDSAADAVGGWEAVCNNAQARMAFYDDQFPDDTPDEWSTAEREKSHGRGASQPGSQPNAEKFLQNWFGRLPSAVIWNGFDAACKGLAHVKTWGDILPISTPEHSLNLVRITRRVFTVD